MRVLVVDDNPVIARLLIRLLEMSGLQGIEITEPAQLLDPHHHLWQITDVLVTDLRMPGVSGFELLAMALTYHPKVKRVVLTGLGEHDIEVAEAARLADVVLHKPDGATTLAQTVKELLA